MGYGNQNTQGNRKSNYNWQFSMIKIMNKIHDALGGASADLKKLQDQANDLVKTFTYADPNDPTLRRVSSIEYSSVSLGLTVTETFTYTLSGAGDYYVTNITLS
jgi:hypothetical protein